MPFYTYAIHNESGKIYIGQTVNLVIRLKRHNKELPTKKHSFTFRNQGQWVIFYQEQFDTRLDAVRREKELKSCQGREFLKGLIKRL